MKDQKGRRRCGLALGAAVLALGLWLVLAPAGRCSVAQNLGYVYLVKGTLASRQNLRAAERWLGAPDARACAPAKSSFGLGHAYLRDGQWGEAISALQASALQAGTPRADLRRYLIGAAREQSGRFDLAREAYEALPRDAAARFYRLGDRADQAGDPRGALRYLAISRAINPANPKAYYRAALIYWQTLRDTDAAAAIARQGLALDQGPSAERDFYQGMLCYYDDNLGCAIAAWAETIREKRALDPDAHPRALAYEMLDRALRNQGRPALQEVAFVVRQVQAR